MPCSPVKTRANSESKKKSSINSPRTSHYLFCVMLRQPVDAGDPRTDPEYDKGCFGRTGCHSKSIMSERYLQENVHLGDRFLFLQGGPSSFADASTLRIAYITPELEGWQRDKQGHCYIHWNSKWDILTNRPLKYEYQFDILDHPGDSEFSDHERQILGILNPKILGDNRNSKAGRSTWYLRNKNIRIDLSSGQAQILLKLYTDYVNGRSPIDFITANDESYP